MTERRTIPPILDNVKHFFIESEDVSDFSKDRLLGKTWEILDILCPLESTAEITLRVPCERLVELGLVSEKVAGEIQSRIVRKEQKDQPDEPQNIISFKRTANGFRILQTYISEEQQGGLCRIDEVINKEATLKKDGDNYDLIVRTRSDNFHLHALDRRWL